MTLKLSVVASPRYTFPSTSRLPFTYTSSGPLARSIVPSLPTVNPATGDVVPIPIRPPITNIFPFKDVSEVTVRPLLTLIRPVTVVLPAANVPAMAALPPNVVPAETTKPPVAVVKPDTRVLPITVVSEVTVSPLLTLIKPVTVVLPAANVPETTSLLRTLTTRF